MFERRQFMSLVPVINTSPTTLVSGFESFWERKVKEGMDDVGGMKASSTFSLGEDWTIITLSGTFLPNTEKDSFPFLWCPRLMFTAAQYPIFPRPCSQRRDG
ncbi:hypothetical protein TNCV_3027111 [Trichonephila clavipes]|nr:hypothetical protein TNCV_3027111 [Trichonephila clavipes]